MKQLFTLLIFAALFSIPATAQLNHSYSDTEKKFKEASELFGNQQYALAYTLLQELKLHYTGNQTAQTTYLVDDVNYFYIVTGLKLGVPIAEEQADQYLDWSVNQVRKEQMSYHLGQYYFMKDDFRKAVENYEAAGLDNLNNEQIANAKFERAYSYFNLKRLNDSKPLFKEIQQMSSSNYYIQANYYHGFISYYERRYEEALKSFRIVEKQADYKRVVPYYIAEIYYFQHKKEAALKYCESIVNKVELYYDKELKQLMGQIHFENGSYAKALPFLEYFINNSPKVSKEILYEESFCYYKTNVLNKAIEGFKQLSSESDSLGQNSMYLLGDCYLRTNQKTNAKNAFQFCAYNGNNKQQQQISLFNYAKLSYELGYQDIALKEMKNFIANYPLSSSYTEAIEIVVNLLEHTNNFNDALVLYESFKKPTAIMQKAYPRILYGRAVEYVNDQQILKADLLMSKILQLPVSTVTPYANFWKGEIACQTQHYDEAIRFLTNYLQSGAVAQGEANSTTAKYNLGFCNIKKENYKQALPYFESIAKSASTASPLQQDAYVRSADCYFMLKNFDKANIIYEAIINNALPQSDYAMFQKGLIAGIKGSDAKISVLKELIRKYPNSNLVPNANLEIASTFMADEKFKDAIPVLTAILNTSTIAGLKPTAFLKLGLSYYNMNNNSQALKYYQQLIELYPLSAEADEALETIRNIYVEENKTVDYIDFMRKNGKNISISEADSLTFVAAELKYTANDFPAAISSFNHYLAQFSNGSYSLIVNYLLGDCYYKNKEWEKSLQAYDFVTGKGYNQYFENATLIAARINYFELKNYLTAKNNFNSLLQYTVSQDNQLEALRGLVRCNYQLKDYTLANEAAIKLLTQKGISTDDKSIAWLVLGKSQQFNSDFKSAIASFKSCSLINKSAWGAESRYEIAHSLFLLGNYSDAEKAALVTIKETGNYDFWLTSAYVLIGDIYMQQKDFFNAKATFQSVAKNSVIVELKNEAKQKLDHAIEEEKLSSKIK
jgi:tetratricopeptide (TPR) repeat protein